ncbi:MAG: HlyD family efflux transporter periplasmic adaptor subunit [Methylococcaceae bacterium]|nr:MAG: HlyD family efflux transporter periplasmic adaptor subunit [Methylococcaceae bacterium]
MIGIDAPAATLPPLREELHCLAGPRGDDGHPTWTLHDPANNRFFRIGWSEYEMLSRWALASPAAIAQAITESTTLNVDAEQVGALANFLMQHNLLRLDSPAGLERLRGQLQRTRHHWAVWLIHNYLFFKIPLLRPDRLLTRFYPYVAWMYSPRFALVVISVGLLGLYLVSRQWERFLGTFLHFFNWQGMVYYGLALTVSKVAHELGHAFTAHRHGCRVPTMGVALLVMFPVLYTDASETWKITERRSRLAIAAAGAIVELGLAAFATLAWSFLPDGPLRSSVFLLAASTWIITLMINLNPFMRMDGYYLLADWMRAENLQPRAFAHNRWQLRRWLFGIDAPPPESLAPQTRRFFVLYAWCTWIYRFTLFMGIALLVYHFAFKVLGLVLMAVEVGWFIVRPTAAEVYAWTQLPGAAFAHRRTRLTVMILAVLTALLLLPWQKRVAAPALLKAASYAEIFVPFGARLDSLPVSSGSPVKAGQPLADLSSADLQFKAGQAAIDVSLLQWQLAYFGLQQALIGGHQVQLKELESAGAKLAGYRRQQEQLAVRAEFDGIALDVNPDVKPGQWLGEGEKLMVVIDPAGLQLEAYLAEDDLLQAQAGAMARFYPDDATLSPMDCRVIRVDHAGAATLQPAFASVYGGDVPARKSANRTLTPDTAVYRVLLQPDLSSLPTRLPHVLRGTVYIEAEGRSPLLRLWRQAVAVLIRESGF